MAGARPKRVAAPPPATAIATAFVAESRRRLRREYLPKIRHATRDLRRADLWWRPNAASNSIANLLLHLDGNVRQWIVHGLGGAADVRRRHAEFTATRGTTAPTLLRRLAATMTAADAVLARLDAATLLQPRDIQGYRVTTLQAVYHVVEHFAGHTGQILYIAKLRLDRDLALYPHLAARRAQRPKVRATARSRVHKPPRRYLRAGGGDVASRPRPAYDAAILPDASGSHGVSRGGP